MAVQIWSHLRLQNGGPQPNGGHHGRYMRYFTQFMIQIGEKKNQLAWLFQKQNKTNKQKKTSA